MTGQVRLRRDGATGTILLDHPARLNALTPGMIADVRKGLDDFLTDSRIRAVILAGEGGAFCTGTDLNTVMLPGGEEAPLDELPSDVAALLELLEAMLRFPRPLLAAVHGWVAGSGLALMLACDIAVADRNARFWVAEPRVGLSPALTAPLLVRRAGHGFAARMLLGSDPVPAAVALERGLVTEIQPEHLVWARAHELAGTMVACEPATHQMTRRVLNEVIGESLFTQLSVAAACTAAARTTAAARDGIQRFLTRREPRSEG